MRCRKKQEGAALIVTLALLLLIGLLGFSAFQWALGEVRIASSRSASVQAQYLAESGTALLLQWFQEPDRFPRIGTFSDRYTAGDPARFLRKRRTDGRGSPSFFDALGESQFSGTAGEPDFEYIGDPGDGGFESEALDGLGGITGLKIYRPASPGAVATIEATGTTLSGISRTVSMELIPAPVPPVTAGLQAGGWTGRPAPVWVHWGDARFLGDADLGDSLEAIPNKDIASVVDDRPYSLSDRRDGWIDVYVGGSILNPKPGAACNDCPEPFWLEGYGHLHQFQSNVQNGFSIDSPDYERLKSFAKSWGRYYGTDEEGFLYREGVRDPSNRLTPAEAFRSDDSAVRRLLVFVDTIDGKPPNDANMATLVLPVDGLEGLFFVQGHLILRAGGSGRPLLVRSPPAEGSEDDSTRRAVVLSGIHLKGLLSSAGRMTVEDRLNVFGAMTAERGFDGPSAPEVWYDADLATGYHPGLPAVTMLKGSFRLQ